MANRTVRDFVRHGSICSIINSFRSFKIIITVKYKFDGNLLINVTLPILKFGKSVAYKPERLYFCKTWNSSMRSTYKLQKKNLLFFYGGGVYFSIPVHKNKSPCRVRTPNLQVSSVML